PRSPATAADPAMPSVTIARLTSSQRGGPCASRRRAVAMTPPSHATGCHRFGGSPKARSIASAAASTATGKSAGPTARSGARPVEADELRDSRHVDGVADGVRETVISLAGTTRTAPAPVRHSADASGDRAQDDAAQAVIREEPVKIRPGDRAIRAHGAVRFVHALGAALGDHEGGVNGPARPADVDLVRGDLVARGLAEESVLRDDTRTRTHGALLAHEGRRQRQETETLGATGDPFHAVRIIDALTEHLEAA